MAIGSVFTERMKLFLALFALQFCFSGFHIVSMVALNIGVSKVVYPVYRNIMKERPPLTSSFLIQFFLLALLGITANQGFYLLGLNYGSPTFASAMQNSVPAITFVMASALGLEQVNIARRDGLAKVVGTIASVVGATVITLYKGPPLLQQTYEQTPVANALEEETSSKKLQNWTWGCVYLLGHCLSWAAWMVLQAPVLKKYPAKLTVTSFTCFFGLIQFLIIAAFVETGFNNWKIQSEEELFTILYAGIVASGIAFSLQTWCIQKGGPVFVAVFQPMQTLLVAIMASLILGDQLYAGGIIGAILIMLGLYSVLWGKREEKRVVAIEEKPETLTKTLLQSEIRGDEEVSDIP
ncbi:hypothetical protein P3X46_000672 [Hevea brasiliensis]|uniref:WAT1-related protein n=1 Tax=Hevea brasiliensis TaxID=3981 RepID=A0ABQ9NA32_HEVBR|nr:hypothetical protein P3X46_000672 [Hevea brasiliensis]